MICWKAVAASKYSLLVVNQMLDLALSGLLVLSLPYLHSLMS